MTYIVNGSGRQCRMMHRSGLTKGPSPQVMPQTKVAFVGKAGCGKSTSVTLIQVCH